VRLAVEAEGIVVRYDEWEALGASTFGIPAGMRTAVIGPNGSGKSTVLSVIAGLVTPDEGTITVLGGAPAARRDRLAYVLQAARVNENLPVTVREVVAMGRYARLGAFGRFTRRDRDAVESAIARLALEDLEGRHLGELSGGQRQRVFVAQGLAQDHELLLLDEPMTGLDLVSRSAIEEAVGSCRADGCTVVVTTHDLDEAMSADHVLLLSNRVVASGPPAEVLTPELLSLAYRSAIVEVGGRILLDDSAHRPVGDPHDVHLDRSSGTHEH
jgi:manganese transport system ATP-binding protein